MELISNATQSMCFKKVKVRNEEGSYSTTFLSIREIRAKVKIDQKVIQIDNIVKANNGVLEFFDVQNSNEIIILKNLPKKISYKKFNSASKILKTSALDDVYIRNNRSIKYCLISSKDSRKSVKYCRILYYDVYEISSVEYFAMRKTDFLDFCLICKSHRDIFRDMSRYSTQELIFEKELEDKINNCTSGILRNQKLLKEYNVRLNIGIILRGNPGNGKTSLVTKIVSNIEDCQVKFFNSTTPIADVSKFRNQCLANGYNNIVVFDDVDINLFNRGKSRDSNDFLTVLDGPEDKGSQKCVSITIFTTNESLSSMDSAFLRPGRIDYVFEIKNPTEQDRELFVSKYHENILKFLSDNEESPKSIAKQTADFSFAMLEGIKSQLVNRMLFNKEKKLELSEIVNEIRSTFNNKKSTRVGL